MAANRYRHKNSPIALNNNFSLSASFFTVTLPIKPNYQLASKIIKAQPQILNYTQIDKIYHRHFVFKGKKMKSCSQVPHSAFLTSIIQRKIFKTLANISVVAALSFSSVTFALEEDDSDEFTDISLEDLLNLEVTVASNFSETELEVGSTVEAIFSRQWKDYGAENVSEAISHLPGTMTYPVPWGGTAIAIRGYTTNLSVRGIATVVDGIPMNTLRTGSALYDIRGYTLPSLDRIEMIRGPGSALYGSDAFHGVLSMKTYQSEEDNTQFNLNYSSEGFKQGNMNFTNISDGGVAFNASVTTIDQGDQDIPYSYTIPTTTTVASSARANSYDAYMGVFKLGVSHSEKFKSNYSFYIKSHDSKESVSGGQSQTPFGSVFVDNDITDGSDKLYALKGDFELGLDDQITFEGKAYHWRSKVTTFTDATSLNIPATIGDGREKLSGIDLLVKQPDNAWNTQWTVGLSYKAGKVLKSQTYFTASADDRTIVGQDVDIQKGFNRNVKSLIFSAKSKFFDNNVQVVYGGRLDDYSDFGKQTTPRIGLIYLPTSNSALKLLYGEAFRAPITSELFGTGQLKGNQDLKPEVIETSEIIYMYQGSFWKLNLTYFKSDWTDGIILSPTNAPGFNAEYTNVGQNEADGLELTYRGSLNNWRWDISASSINSKAITAAGDIDYVAFPEQIYNINFGYYFEAHNLDLYLTNRLQVSAKEGPINANVPNPESLKDYSATDITLDWGVNEQWNLQAGIRNVFDKDNFIPAVWNNENGVRTLGRYFQLGFTYTL